MLFSLGFVSIFVTGGLSGLFLGQPQIDAYFHDTYFVVAHFHMIMGIAALFGIFAATFYWFPLMFGRMMDERLGKSFLSYFRFRLRDFSADALCRVRGQSAALFGFHDLRFPAPVMPLQRWITYSAYALAASQLIFLVNLFHSMRRGVPAPANPWRVSSREWPNREHGRGVLPGTEPGQRY